MQCNRPVRWSGGRHTQVSPRTCYCDIVHCCITAYLGAWQAWVELELEPGTVTAFASEHWTNVVAIGRFIPELKPVYRVASRSVISCQRENYKGRPQFFTSSSFANTMFVADAEPPRAKPGFNDDSDPSTMLSLLRLPTRAPTWSKRGYVRVPTREPSVQVADLPADEPNLSYGTLLKPGQGEVKLTRKSADDQLSAPHLPLPPLSLAGGGWWLGGSVEKGPDPIALSRYLTSRLPIKATRIIRQATWKSLESFELCRHPIFHYESGPSSAHHQDLACLPASLKDR